jgi:hypothetical protein
MLGTTREFLSLDLGPQHFASLLLSTSINFEQTYLPGSSLVLCSRQTKTSGWRSTVRYHDML